MAAPGDLSDVKSLKTALFVLNQRETVSASSLYEAARFAKSHVVPIIGQYDFNEIG